MHLIRNKNCIILSQTFYIDDKDHNKIYLFESIIDNKWLILEVINSFVEKYKIESDFAEAIINNVKERNYN